MEQYEKLPPFIVEKIVNGYISQQNQKKHTQTVRKCALVVNTIGVGIVLFLALLVFLLYRVDTAVGERQWGVNYYQK